MATLASTPSPKFHATQNIWSSGNTFPKYFFAEHKRDELQSFASEEHPIRPLTKSRFLKLLNVSSDVVPPPDIALSMRTFVDIANSLSTFLNSKHFADSTLLVFKSTGRKAPLGHVASTRCRPNVIGAFEEHWTDDDNTLWPCIKVAGKIASEGKSQREQLDQAASYLHYLLLARPDLHVAQGFLVGKKDIHFLFGIGGVGLWGLSVLWEDSCLYELMYAFIYRLYEPSNFQDESYVAMVPNLQENYVTYTIRVTDPRDKVMKDCPGFRPVYSVKPFRTRTHILCNPESDIMIGGKGLKVIKEQLCPKGTPFTEFDVLTEVHGAGVVPGVVEVVFQERIKLIPRALRDREKLRLGFRQFGRPILSVGNLKGLLELLYDLLEVIRYIYVKRGILHRDISKGNVLFTNDMPSRLAGGPDGTPTVDICFIQHLLDERIDALETSVLLVDFNCGEDLAEMKDPETSRIGTPVFMGRAIDLQGPVRFPRHIGFIPSIPSPNDKYSRKYPDRILKFPPTEEEIMRTPAPDSANRPWHPDLDHDAESVFWLLVYWAAVAHPVGLDFQKIRSSFRELLIGDYSERNSLLKIFATAGGDNFPHSFFKPLMGLIKELAAILDVDRHWISTGDPRNNPEYVPEAFQRLIFQFVLDHSNEAFMTKTVESRRLRSNETTQPTPSLTTDTIPTGSKRPASSLSSHSRKRSRNSTGSHLSA